MAPSLCRAAHAWLAITAMEPLALVGDFLLELRWYRQWEVLKWSEPMWYENTISEGEVPKPNNSSEIVSPTEAFMLPHTDAD